jgi:hypothetical protein
MRWVVREPRGGAAARFHRVDLEVAVAIARKRDLFIVRRPRRHHLLGSLGVGEASRHGVRSVRGDVQLEVCVAVVDENDLPDALADGLPLGRPTAVLACAATRTGAVEGASSEQAMLSAAVAAAGIARWATRTNVWRFMEKLR